MQQHVGAPNSPTVNVGDRDDAGQKIGSSEAFISAPVHASVSGTVKAIEGRPNFTGAQVQSVVIQVDPSQPPGWAEKRDTGSLGAEQIRDCLLYTSPSPRDLLCVDLGGR